MGDPRKSVTIDYTNWRGERSKRRVIPLAISFENNEWHPDTQWLLMAADMDKGGEIRFLGPADDGNLGGMIATVEENKPHEFISLLYTGQIIDGAEDTTSEAAKAFIGAHENYSFREADGVTTVNVELDSEGGFVADFVTEFNAAWPLALARLKEIAESRR